VIYSIVLHQLEMLDTVLPGRAKKARST